MTSSPHLTIRLRMNNNNDDNTNNTQLSWQDLKTLEDEIGVEQVKQRLRGCELVFPQPPPPPLINQQHEERMKHLRARQEQREYSRMMQGGALPGTIPFLTTKSISPEHTGTGIGGFRQSLVALNMIIGAGAAFVVAFYACGVLGMSTINKTIMGMFALVSMLFLEMVLFIIRADKFQAIDEKMQARANKSFNGFAPVGRNLDQLSESERLFLDSLEDESKAKKQQ